MGSKGFDSIRLLVDSARSVSIGSMWVRGWLAQKSPTDPDRRPGSGDPFLATPQNQVLGCELFYDFINVIIVNYIKQRLM